MLARLVLAGDDEQFGIEFVAVTAMDRLLMSLLLPATMPLALADAGLAQRARLGAVADDVVVGIAGGRVDDGQPMPVLRRRSATAWPKQPKPHRIQ